MTMSPGTTLRTLRERKPLVHQITNYVVMNETANATLAIGALPVMAHAREEVATLVGVEAEVRGVESIAAGSEPAELAAAAARTLGCVASVTGVVDHVSD